MENETRRIALKIAYDGSAYAGWQRQENGVGIQAVLEDTLQRQFGESVHVMGSGRTDAGVHARFQVISFHTSGSIPTGNLKMAMNGLLPGAIRVLDAAEEEEGFNARKSAFWKRYEYRIRLIGAPDPFTRNYAWQLEKEPDLDALRHAAEMVLGTHDFSGFQSRGSTPVSPVKTIYESSWRREGRDLYYRISGNGFVYHMVRNLVWAMVQAGLGLKRPEEFREELRGERGSFENSPAPAQGLYLDYVSYAPWNGETTGDRSC